MTDLLPNDSPASDTTDIALKARIDGLQHVHDIQWLTEGQPVTAEPAGSSLPVSVAKDVGKGIIEAPRMALGGVRDAAQAFLDLGDELERLVPVGGVQFFDDEGNFDMRYVPPAELAAEYAQTGGPELPDVGKANSNTGSMVRGISQFVAGMYLGGKALGGISGATKIGTAARVTGASAFSDFFAFDGQQERLSNLVQSVPALQNPVTEFLAAKENDPELLGRLKNVLEGAGIDGVTALATSKLLRKGLIAYKKTAAAIGEAGGDAAGASTKILKNIEAEKLLRDATDMRAIGNASDNAPLLFKKAVKAVKETADSGVPDSVLADSLVRERGLSPLGANSDYYVNFAKINAPEDIQRIIQDTSSAFAPSIEEAKRGVRTNVMTKLSADKVDAWQTLAARRTGEPLNAEQALAARELWASAADKLSEVAELASATPTPENLFQFRKMLSVYHGIQKEVLAARAETARALQSWAIPAGGGKERMQSMAMMLDRFGGVEASAELARKIAIAAKMPGGAQVIANLAEKGTFAKGLASVQEYWINALLSGPKTHMANIMSNTGVVAASMVERAAASKLSRFLGTEAGVEIGEAAAQAAGIRGGILDAFRYAGKAIRSGETGFGLDKIEAPRLKAISSTAWNVRSDSWLGKAIDGLGTIVNVPGRMLAAEDEFFKTIGYRMELHAQAQRTAVRELPGAAPKEIAARVAQILENPPEALRLNAVDMAAYQTFTNAGGDFVKTISRVKHKYPALNFVLPFVNTPANILKYTFERTPLAPLSARYRTAIAKGGAEADLAMTKMGLGTIGLLMAIDLGMNGVTSGSGPSAPSETQNWRRQGNQPYSVRFGDKQIAFNRLDPLGYHLGIGADIAEYLLNTEGGDDTGAEVQEAMSASVFAIAENVTSKSYLQGLSLLMEAINDPDRFAPSYLERFTSSFVPTGVAEIARAVDPVRRHAHDIVSAIKARTPGLSADLPARRDLWGRELTYQSGMGGAFDTFSPLYGSTYKPEPIDLAMAAGGWYVGMPSKTLQIDGENVSLKNKPAIYNEYLLLQGGTKPSEYGKKGAKVVEKYGDGTLLETLNAIVQGQHPLSESFAAAKTPDDQERIIDKVIGDYRRAARAIILDKYPELGQSSATKKAARLKRQQVVPVQ
jgi:hypothetical protein